jgi:hypothetical protein
VKGRLIEQNYGYGRGRNDYGYYGNRNQNYNNGYDRDYNRGHDDRYERGNREGKFTCYVERGQVVDVSYRGIGGY